MQFVNFFKDQKLHEPINFISLWKNLPMIIYSKLHEKNHVITFTN